MNPTSTQKTTPNLVEINNLVKWFPVQRSFLDKILAGKKEFIRAVDGVTFTIKKGEAFGLAGESGSGKTTIGRLAIGLETPTKGRVKFDGIDLNLLDSSNLRRLRKRMQVIFQDPMASLNPRMTLGDAVTEGLRIHFPIKRSIGYWILRILFAIGAPATPYLIWLLFGLPQSWMGYLVGGLILIDVLFIAFMIILISRKEENPYRNKVLDIFDKVGLSPATYFYNKFPHQISGGQRQRVVIARALVTTPDLILADEPIAMADVSVRALLLDLMVQLKKEFNLTYLFITHDLATAKYICDRIGVLYLGKMAEMGDLREVYGHPLHPYTRALMAAVPIPDPTERRTQPMPAGEIPNPIDPPSGCRFHPRCTMAKERCSRELPELRELRPGHMVACHFAEKFLD